MKAPSVIPSTIRPGAMVWFRGFQQIGPWCTSPKNRPRRIARPPATPPPEGKRARLGDIEGFSTYFGAEGKTAAGNESAILFLPAGGEGILKSFIDEVVRDPSVLSENQMATAGLHRNESTEVFASLEAAAVKALEADVLPELDNDTVLIGPEERAPSIAASAPPREREAAPKIRFACECGQSTLSRWRLLAAKGNAVIAAGQ